METPPKSQDQAEQHDGQQALPLPVMLPRLKTEEKMQPRAFVPCMPTHVYQPTTFNQSFGYFQGGSFMFLPNGTQNLPSKDMPAKTPQPSSSTSSQNYVEKHNYAQRYCVPPTAGCPQFLPDWTQNWPPMSTPQTPQPPLRGPEYNRGAVNVPQKNYTPALPGSAADMSSCQLRNTTSSLPHGAAGVGDPSSQKPVEEVLQKRELRLMKNREAARECRRKKKEYVRCLENRVAVLENQNKTLIEELRALKDIYRHKVE
ncbi:cAMP-responsive element modulator-like isoform X2 [Mugil cephalus]|nr:cAMP-responsive element modulator-like isoform X2 [Mugil cephalus]